VRTRVQIILAWVGRVGIAFLVLLATYVAMGWIAPRSSFRLLVEVGTLVTGLWLAIRVMRRVARQAVWRLRNRLLVTYLFIAVVPITLIPGLTLLSAYSLVRQMAVFLATSQLDRRIEGLAGAAASVARVNAAARVQEMPRVMDLVFRDRFAGVEMLLRQSGREYRYPEHSALPAPAEGWKPTTGLLRRDGQYYLWRFMKTNEGDITITAPVTSEFLADLVPDLGVAFQGPDVTAMPNGRNPPPAISRFDTSFVWLADVPAAVWDRPGAWSDFQLGVWARVSAVLATVFNRAGDSWQALLQATLIAGLAVLGIVEVTSLIIGIAMVRTITGAVHHLYEGTQKVMEGDFSHRIHVSGKDQLGELSVSFNRMTENLERLLVVAKEKERLQSEIEIAREVQNQLYPPPAPRMKTMRVTAACQPARIVSGDYYDYEVLGGDQIAMAIGDVAGKGISAALLMATIQSSLRTHLTDGSEEKLSPAWLVSQLNRHLYATTSSEKFATFCLGLYDEASSTFTYTNAGHVPPILVRNGAAQRLEVNGTIVGAFPFSEYGQNCVTLESGDLLVCFTDGITEPENEYGEMFGEERLVDLVSKNAHRSEAEIVGMILDGVRQWTASDELQDDMTLLLARRV
jgi:sigma-B regulation protein RsbU (phosphoserine phosphatase)